MTLSEKMLAGLSEVRDDGVNTTIVDDGYWHLTLETNRHDRMSCSVIEVKLARLTEAPAGLTVRQWADRIAGSVSGLREDLKVLEVDAKANVALLRSDSPSKKESRVGYYEVILNGVNQATMQRYEAETKTSARREQVSFPLTHEVLAKLVDDITA